MLLVGAGSGGPRAVAGFCSTVVFGLCVRIQWSVAVAAVRSGAAGACGGLQGCSVTLSVALGLGRPVPRSVVDIRAFPYDRYTKIKSQTQRIASLTHVYRPSAPTFYRI